MSSYRHISFKRQWILRPEVLYQLGQCDCIVSTISETPLSPKDYRKLYNVALIKGAQATTAIEGNTLSDDEVERVAAGQNLAPSKEYQELEVRNVLDAMNALLGELARKNEDSLVTPELLLRFHQMIGRDLGEHFDASPGKFRGDARVVGSYRCPDHREVPTLIRRLCEWLKEEFGYASGNQSFVDAVVEAIVAHVYLEWIHPFGDGNGRTGRLLEFYILLRAGNPDVASHILSNFYNLTRPEYYRQLGEAGKTGDLTNFISYAVQGFRDGLMETLRTIQERQFKTAWRSYIYDTFARTQYRKVVFKRRRNLALELPISKWLSVDEIPLVSVKIARDYGSLSKRTLLRDLQALVEMELVLRSGSDYRANSKVLRQQMPERHRRE